MVMISLGLNSPLTAAREKRVSAGISVIRCMRPEARAMPNSPSRSAAEKEARPAAASPIDSKCSNSVCRGFRR